VTAAASRGTVASLSPRVPSLAVLGSILKCVSMIGFILRSFCLLGGEGFCIEGFCVVVATTIVAICAMCGINQCMKLRMRDCGCIKKWMRATGADKFDDFEMMVLVHEVQYTSSRSKLSTLVRVTAGLQTVETDPSSKGIFQQPLSVFVEQGTDSVNVELLNSRERKVLACLKLDPVQDVLKNKQGITEKLIPMKQKSKGVLNPRIKLTVMLDSEEEVERGLLEGMGAEQTMLVRQQLQKTLHESSPEKSQAGDSIWTMEHLAKACSGELDLFGSWGSKQRVYVAIHGIRKYQFGVWKDKSEFDRGAKANPDIDLLKIISVQPDPHRTEVFVLNYRDDMKLNRRLVFRRIDRTRDVWVDMFQMVIKMVHEQKDAKKKAAQQPKLPHSTST